MTETMPAGIRPLNVAIVGGGPGCMAIMDIIFGDQLMQFPMKLVGLADINPQAPAIKRAEAAGIFTTLDYHRLFALPRLNLIIELTGNDDVLMKLEREKPGSARLMDHSMARLFWDLSRLGDEKRLAEKRYKDLFDFAREGLALFDERGEITECNFSLAHLLGYNRPELDRKRLFELAVNESRKILQHHLADLKILGFTTAEMEFTKKDGKVLPVEASIAWLPEEHLFRMMLRDITASRKLEESRKAYSERLEEEVEKRTRRLKISEAETRRQKRTAESIINGSPIPMFIINSRHQITYWNRACEKLTGLPGAEMIGTDRQWEPFYPGKRPLLSDLIIEGDIGAMEDLYRDRGLRRSPLVDGGFEAEDFFPHLGPEGAHLYMSAAPITDDTGEIQGAVVAYQDFTERVQMLEEIRRRENFVQNLIHNSIDGIIATGPKGKITIFNRGASDILGYDPWEIIEHASYPEILSKEAAHAVRGAFYGNRFGPPGKIINMELNLLNKEREPIPARLSGTLLFESGEEVGSVVFIQDLREIQRLQSERDQAERMAAVGMTVAGLAHYIKNIVTGLKGGAYVIRSALSKQDLDLIGQGWGMVERNIDQISCIVTVMLIYSRKGKPSYDMVDPNALVREVVELMTEKARLSGVSIRHEPTRGIAQVPMDRMAIHRCLLDLLSNAIDACALEGILKDRGVVTIEAGQTAEGGVRFRVSDNGTGMDEETQKRLFSDFFTTKGYKGTGLGLPVTHKIVREHGGSLTFESRAGKGTVFDLVLPGSARQEAGS